MTVSNQVPFFLNDGVKPRKMAISLYFLSNKFCYIIKVYSKLEVRSERISTVQTGISRLFGNRKKVYYCQMFTIYHMIYSKTPKMTASKVTDLAK